MTIHKVQGMTQEKVCAEYSPSFSNPLVYVALSRVTSAQGLFVNALGVKPNKKGHLFQHPPCLEEEQGEHLTAQQKRQRERLRDEYARFMEEKERLRNKGLKLRWQPILDASPLVFRVLYHNVQSLVAHQEDLRIDSVFMGADVLLLAETWLTTDVEVSLGDSWHVTRCDRAPGRRGGGVAIFTKSPHSAQSFATQGDMEVAVVHLGPLRLAVIYCHGKPTAAAVMQAVRAALPPQPGMTTILCGDFNIDMSAWASGAAGKQLVTSMASMGLEMRNSVNETTTYDNKGKGTIIDGVFSDYSGVSVERYQSYFSHHLPLVSFIN